MDVFKSIFSQMLMDYQITQTTEKQVLDFKKRDPDTLPNCKNIKSETNKEENYLTSETFNNVSTLDNADTTLLISNSYCLDINNQNITPEINTVFSPDNQNIKTTEDEENFKYCVDVEHVNNNYNLPEITLNSSLLNNSFKQTDSVQNKTQTEFNIIETDQYEMYDENIKKLDITDHMNGYDNMSDIVDLDEFEQFLDFDISNDTTFIDNIKDVEDVIERFRIKNDLTLVTEENEQKRILDNTISKDLKHQIISDSNDELTENNLQKTVFDKKSIISIRSESDDELNDLKLPLSFTDLETVSLSSLEEQINTGYINNNAVIENTTKDVLTIPLDQFNTFDHAGNEDANDLALENSNSNIALVTFDDSDSCSGYNSSYFEFITEDEANETRFIELTSKDTCKTIKISLDTNSSESEKTKEIGAAKKNGNTSISYDYRNAAARYYNYNFARQNIHDYSYRQNHVLPEGDSYLHLFKGMFAPTVTRMMENKMTESSSIYVQYEGIGFDMRAVKDQDSDEEFEEEAKQSASKILSIYPSENKKRRRY